MRHPRNDAARRQPGRPGHQPGAGAGLPVLLLRWAARRGPPGVELVVANFGVGALGLPDRVLYVLGFVNVSLAVFNALPIPPLDGSAVVARLLPPAALPAWYSFQRYSMPVLLLVVLLHPGNFLDHLFGPAERAWARLSPPDQPTRAVRRDR